MVSHLTHDEGIIDRDAKHVIHSKLQYLIYKTDTQQLIIILWDEKGLLTIASFETWQMITWTNWSKCTRNREKHNSFICKQVCGSQVLPLKGGSIFTFSYTYTYLEVDHWHFLTFSWYSHFWNLWFGRDGDGVVFAIFIAFIWWWSGYSWTHLVCFVVCTVDWLALLWSCCVLFIVYCTLYREIDEKKYEFESKDESMTIKICIVGCR